MVSVVVLAFLVSLWLRPRESGVLQLRASPLQDAGGRWISRFGLAALLLMRVSSPLCDSRSWLPTTRLVSSWGTAAMT